MRHSGARARIAAAAPDRSAFLFPPLQILLRGTRELGDEVRGLVGLEELDELHALKKLHDLDKLDKIYQIKEYY